MDSVLTQPLVLTVFQIIILKMKWLWNQQLFIAPILSVDLLGTGGGDIMVQAGKLKVGLGSIWLIIK